MGTLEETRLERDKSGLRFIDLFLETSRWR